MKKLMWILVAVASSGGCKQGLGERCQINDDCVSPYVCNQAKMQCQETTTGGIDATVPDAPFNVVDASPTDAAVDAVVDSTVADAATD